MPTLRHNIANILSTSFTLVNLSIKKVIYPRNLFFASVERLSPGVVVDTDRESIIRLGKRVSMHSRCRVTSTCGGELTIGDRVSFNVGCIVTCRKKITIGKNVSFGPNVLIYDHDHIMNCDSGVKGAGYIYEPVEIGDNAWIGAGTIILRGARIGNNCVIGAGSVVKGNIPDNTTLIQKRVSLCKGSE